MNYVIFFWYFFPAKKYPKTAPQARPKVPRQRRGTAQSLSFIKTGLRRSAAAWSEVLDFAAVSSIFETALTFEAITPPLAGPKPPRF